MRYLLIIFASFLITSCVTEKKRLKICQSCPLKIKDSIQTITTITPFDTTLFLSQMGRDIAVDFDQNNCCSLVDTLNAMMSRSNGTITTNNGIKASIFKKDKRLVFRCEADSLKEIIKLLREKKETTRDRTIEVPARCNLEHLKWYDTYCRWITLFTLTFLIGALLWRFRKLIF